MPDISLAAAALAGLLSFFSPCILPMVPFYLCYLAGQSLETLRAGRAGDPVQLLGRACVFALGVTTIFVLLGLGASALGQALRIWHRELSWLAAGILLLFGLHFLGILRVPLLARGAQLQGPVRAAGLVPAYLLGLSFGFAWTPCVGPTLSAILLMASASGEPVSGAVLLGVYGLAMTLPFVLAAGFTGPFMAWMQRRPGWIRNVERLTGVFLIVFAGLLASGGVALIAQRLLVLFPQLARLG